MTSAGAGHFAADFKRSLNERKHQTHEEAFTY
jgi:hypothetical protein